MLVRLGENGEREQAMSFAEKMRERATKLADQAQERIAQGQAKLTELQVRKQADALLRDLGAAVWAAQRQGGPHQPIEDAMAALDIHVGKHGPIDTEPTAPDEARAPEGATTGVDPNQPAGQASSGDPHDPTGPTGPVGATQPTDPTTPPAP
jgi:hypothetical protein